MVTEVSIRETETGVLVTIEDPPPGSSALIDELTACATGCFNCPAAEAGDFETLKVTATPHKLVIRLDSKLGMPLPVRAIEKCVAAKLAALGAAPQDRKGL